MRELTPETITDAVLDQMATTPDPRLKAIMESAVKHLHAFASEVNLTPAEWIKGIEFMTAGGSDPYQPAGPVLPRSDAYACGRQFDRQKPEARQRVRAVRPRDRRARQAGRQRDRLDLADRCRRSLRHPGQRDIGRRHITVAELE